MTYAELPVYLIALRDTWLCVDAGPALPSALAFGDEASARRYAEHEGERTNTPLSLYRIVEYR